MSDFMKGLDDILGINPAAPTAAKEDIYPVSEPVPVELSHEDEQYDDRICRSSDPFGRAIDDMIQGDESAELELRRRYNPMNGDPSKHDWEMQREVLFSGEKYKFRCLRCMKWLSVSGNQTMTEALNEQGVDPNCGMNVINGIMDES